MRSILLAATLFANLAACNEEASRGPETGSGKPPLLPEPVTLAERPGATGGEALYLEKCIMCHGDIGMGTGLLARRVEPSVANLEQREDLPAEYVIQAARVGIGNMPAIARGEVNDEQLRQIAAYLAQGSQGSGQ